MLAGHLDGDPEARRQIGNLVDAACAGDYDAFLRAEPDPYDVHVTTSAHLMVLAVMNRLNGMRSEDFYKNDPVRYVRLNLLIQRLLGIERLTVGSPVYAFAAELLGQTMMYPEDQAPGSDPGRPLLEIGDWREIPGYDEGHELARGIRETLVVTGQLAGIEPVAHLAAPYSLAAEIFGQEALINALNTEPDTVRCLLERLVEVVIAPWCEDLAANVPDVWLELSDASGSPMFIGPHNFLSFAVDPVVRLIGTPGWGSRVFVANYRGDSPPGRATHGRRRRQPSDETAMSFDKLLDAKISCCPLFITRLEADAASEQTYADVALVGGLSLYLGVGAVRLDRNSVVDKQGALSELHDAAFQRAKIIRSVRSGNGAQVGLVAASTPPRVWSGDIYIEDTNGETDLDLFAAVLEGCAEANSAAAA